MTTATTPPPLESYTPEEIEHLRTLMTPEELRELDMLLAPSLQEIESDWRIWLKTLFPQFMRGELAPYHIEYWDWWWAVLMAKRAGAPLPDGENAFMNILWRGGAKSTHSRLAPISEAAILKTGYCLYLGGTQDQANKHLTSIEALLTSDKMRFYYPLLSKPRVSGTDKNRAWNQKMLYCRSGYVMQGIGLDVGIRGANIDDMRVSLLIPDDIDDRSDTPLQSEQKMDKFLHSILPTKKAGTIFICSQNLVIESGVINRIYTGEVPALANARISGPHQRVLDLRTEQRTINGRPRDIVVGGTVTWPGNDSLELVQEDIDTYTLPVFLRECQHQLAVDRTGLVLSRWDDSVHVITESEFASVFKHRLPPPHWNKYIGHDWAVSKSAYHANVVAKVSISNQNEPLPGCIFIYDAMSFEAGTQADDVAVRILRSIAPTVLANGYDRTWDEVLSAELQRVNLHEFVPSATQLIDARRNVLAKIIPPLVAPLLKKNSYQGLRMSHEAKDQRNVYRRVFGLGFTGVNPRRDGGIEFINHYQRVDETRKHPFKDRMGWTQMYLIVPDEKEGYPISIRPDSLHDSDLARYQFCHHRYTEPHLTNTGIIEHGPEKMHDDFTNLLMMLFHDNQPMARSLSYSEQVEELIAPESRLETLQRESPLPPSITGRQGLTARQEFQYHMAREAAAAQIKPERRSYDEWLQPID